MKRDLIITLDGPSGTGKSTAARGLARRLGYLYLDTGAMYRAVALQALRNGVSLGDPKALERLARRACVEFRRGKSGGTRVLLNGSDVTAAIRSPAVAEAASRVAVVPAVRRALVHQQRALGARGGIVAEGRDTGTVVFPAADLKFYLTADAAERAQRRCRELRQAGDSSVRFEAVLRSIRRRDRRDRLRRVSPLKPAPGAIRVDNTGLQSSETLAILIAYVRGAKSSEFIRH